MDRVMAGQKRTFQIVLIKPSHYDDDGYVIQWPRAFIPSNSLAVVHSIARDAAHRAVLGPDVDYDFTVIDEIQHARRYTENPERNSAGSGGFGLVALVGVQSNQFPRALDLARPLRAAGIPVIIGGFHVSGCLAMLPECSPTCRRRSISASACSPAKRKDGMDELLRDAAAGTLQPIYNYMNDLPALEAAADAAPAGQASSAGRSSTTRASTPAAAVRSNARSAPSSMCRAGNRAAAPPDDIEQTIREHWAEGITHFFITDDNFARNKDWEPIFDRHHRVARARQARHPA